jgi:mono/diheme cytochrome c family protein
LTKVTVGTAWQRLARIGLAIGPMLLVMIGIADTATAQKATGWQAPANVKSVKNPEKSTPEVLKEAGALYRDNCATCHGITGQGDGPTAEEMTDPPADFTDAKVMNAATDGELFWKITTGFLSMPSWSKLTETQRWQLVNYLRTLVPKVTTPAKPQK